MNILSLIKNKMLYTSQRSEVIATNIANANTPKFKTKDLKPFKESVKKNVALNTTNAQHITNNRSEDWQSYQANNTFVKLDGNDVDLENEIIKMNHNGIEHQKVVNIYNKMLSFLRIVSGNK